MTYSHIFSNIQTESQIFPPTTGGGQQMAKEMDVPFIGKIPLDPRIGHKIINSTTLPF